MKIKKAHEGAKVFELRFIIQNMRETVKKCMSNSDLFKRVIFLLIIFIFNSTLVYAGVEEAGTKMYYKLVEIGKWVIIFKGGIDIIQSVINGDMQSAKKMFMGYIFAYAVLWALPWCMDEVETVFKEM